MSHICSKFQSEYPPGYVEASCQDLKALGGGKSGPKFINDFDCQLYVKCLGGHSPRKRAGMLGWCRETLTFGVAQIC